jgi:hypothetical protein
VHPPSCSPPAPATCRLLAPLAIRARIFSGVLVSSTDLGLLKNFALLERMSLQFRAEFFNAFNNVNFSQPQNYLGTNGTGQITSAQSPRVLQFALKLMF